MKGMGGAIATITWGIILSFIVYIVVSLLAHYVGFISPLPLYVAVVIGFSTAIMSSYSES